MSVLSSILREGNYSVLEDDELVELVGSHITVSMRVLEVTWLNDVVLFAQPVSTLLGSGGYSFDEDGAYVAFSDENVMVELEVMI